MKKLVDHALSVALAAIVATGGCAARNPHLVQVAQIQDSFRQVLPALRAQQRRYRDFFCVPGVWVSSPTLPLVILSVSPDAEAAGLRRGDQIVAIDGVRAAPSVGFKVSEKNPGGYLATDRRA